MMMCFTPSHSHSTQALRQELMIRLLCSTLHPHWVKPVNPDQLGSFCVIYLTTGYWSLCHVDSCNDAGLCAITRSEGRGDCNRPSSHHRPRPPYGIWHSA